MTGIRPRQWVAVHRKHHAYTDIAGDPHSPVVAGWAAVQFGNVWMYRKVAKDDATVARYARDLPADQWDRVLFDHAFVGLGLGPPCCHGTRSARAACGTGPPPEACLRR